MRASQIGPAFRTGRADSDELRRRARQQDVDWKAESCQQLTVPLGGGVGRIILARHQVREMVQDALSSLQEAAPGIRSVIE